MGILSGIVSYLFGLSLNLLDAAINGFLGSLGFDLDTFEQYFPAASQFHDIIIGFAAGLLFIMLVFQIFRNFGVMLDMEAEDPLKMLGKTALFFGMIVYSRSIIDLILGLMADPYAIFLNAASAPYQFELVTLVSAIFNSVFSNPFMSIVSVILMLVMGWQFLKLTVECVERYVVFYFALYCAPVVFATGAFKSTAQIFKSWCRLVGSQAMLLLINIWSIKLFLSFMPVFESSGNDMVFTFLMGYAFLKFAQKADTLLRILGLNTASTGDMVRSLGGAIAGAAMTIRSAAGMVSAVGKHFRDAGTAASKGGESGGSTNRGFADEVSGMGSRKGESGGQGMEHVPEAQENNSSGGVTLSGINAAKQGFVTDVMRAARSRMERGPFTPEESSFTADGEAAIDKSVGKKTDVETGEGKVPLGRGSQLEKAAPSAGFHNLDIETLEGLSNLAHGLSHDKFDKEKGAFSGGGFPVFTGEDANIIGASQLTPAEGVERSILKNTDGSYGTVYRNTETGEAHMVQFSSVDNGVMQGSISKIDPETGKIGEALPFKAVHSSVPGAESFSSHTVPVCDPSGGVYHVATKADTSVFSDASSSGPVSNSAYTPGGASRMEDTSGTGATGMPDRISENTLHTTAVEGANTVGSIHTQAMKGSAVASSVSETNSTIHQETHTESGVHGETPQPTRYTVDAPIISTGMQSQNQIRRFSKNNPANLEVFRREKSRIEAFEKPKPDSEPGPAITPPKKS